MLRRDDADSQFSGLAVLEMQTRYDKQIRRPTLQVLKVTLEEWENQQPGPDQDVRAQAQALVDSLVRKHERLHWLRGLRLSSKAP
jgi:hemerythrin-like domain-containing protein